MYNVSKSQGKRAIAVLLSSKNDFQDHHEHHLHLSKLEVGKSGRSMFARIFQVRPGGETYHFHSHSVK